MIFNPSLKSSCKSWQRVVLTVFVIGLSSNWNWGFELADYLPYTPGQSSNLSSEPGFELELVGEEQGKFQWTISGLGQEGLRQKYRLNSAGLFLEEEFGISPDGLTEVYEEAYEPVWNLLPASVEASQIVESSSVYNGSEIGESWSGTSTGTATVGQVELVQTPAGDFDALKVTMVSNWSETGTSYSAEGTVTQTWWMAEDRGVVRLDYAFTEQYTESGETENEAGEVSFLLASSTLSDLPAITTQPVDTSITAGLTAEFSVVATGPGTLTYQWFKDGDSPVGDNQATLTIAEATATDAGTYVVHITNHNGTTISDTVTLTVNSSEVIDVPDSFLKREILRANEKFEGDVTRADLEGLTVLDAGNRGVKDLTGLEYAINLTDLRLGRNAITDLTPLTGLSQMQYLRLGNNMITSLEPLANMVNLVILDLSANQVSDISVVANMSELHTFAAPINQITSMEPLRGLSKLVEVNLSANAGISDLSPIADIVRIQELSVTGGAITDITPLSGLLNLKQLALSENQITDISPIQSHQFIERLYLNDNEIVDIQPIANYTRLSQVWVNLNYLDIAEGADDRLIINTLITRGANVIYDPQKEAPFEGPRFVAKLTGETVQLEWFEIEGQPNQLQESTDLTNWVDSEISIEMDEGGMRSASLDLGDASAKFFRLFMEIPDE